MPCTWPRRRAAPRPRGSWRTDFAEGERTARNAHGLVGVMPSRVVGVSPGFKHACRVPSTAPIRTSERSVMRYQLAPIYCRPWLMNGLSLRLIESHYENNYGGAMRRLNAITEKLESLDLAK